MIIYSTSWLLAVVSPTLSSHPLPAPPSPSNLIMPTASKQVPLKFKHWCCIPTHTPGDIYAYGTALLGTIDK